MINFLYSIDNILNERILGGPRHWLLQNSRFWLRPIMVIVVLLLSVLLAFKAPPRLLILIPVLLLGIGVVLLFLRWPPLGLVALIGTIIIPYSGPSNSNASMVFVALLLGLWLLNVLVRQREIKLVNSKSVLPALVLVLVALLAFGVGQLPWYTFTLQAPLGAQLGGLSLYILSVGLFLLVAHQVREIKWLAWLTWLFLAMGGVYIAGRLVPGLGTLTNTLFISQATGSLFWVWLVALSFSQALFNRSLPFGGRVALGVLLGATLYVALVQGWEWNSGWLPPLVAMVVIFLAAKPKLGFLALLVGAIGALIKSQKLVNAIIVGGDNEYSLSTRLEAWQIVWEITKVNPLLGLGPANYHWYTPLFPIRGYAVQFNSHSQYVDLIAQTGFLGLACFLWFFGSAGWLGWQLRKRVPDGFARAYVYGAIGGVAGTLTAAALGDWVIPFFYNINLGGFRSSMLSWLFLGGLVALEQMYVNRASTKP
jgi:O-antigen ligase